MKDGAFVFDGVVHMYDFTARNSDDPQGAARVISNFLSKYSKPGYPMRDGFGLSAEDVADAHRILFEESDTDIAMAQTVPNHGGTKFGPSPAYLNHALKEAFPDRVLFCGGVDPLTNPKGLKGALEEMEMQVNEWGAVSMKFYQAHHGGVFWRADDREIAYPIWEKCQELGIKVVQFHKGVPLGPQNVEQMRAVDLQQAANDFPDLTFAIHHLGVPYVDETISVAERYPNVWLVLSFWLNMLPITPIPALHQLGKALFQVGPDRLIYGSESFAWPSVQPYIDYLWDLEMPDELQDGYGYPPLTREIKAKILGENFAGLMGVDVEAKKRELAAAS